MTTYQLSAYEAERHEHGATIKFRLYQPDPDGFQPPHVDIEIKTPDDLEAATREYINQVFKQYPNQPTIAVSRSALTRHAPGCKALPFHVIVDNPTTQGDNT
jgi:hypothetical protein